MCGIVAVQQTILEACVNEIEKERIAIQFRKRIYDFRVAYNCEKIKYICQNANFITYTRIFEYSICNQKKNPE